MRILAVADIEDEGLVAHLRHVGGRRYDAVVSCGDLGMPYLDRVATLANAPLLYVRGNHDTEYEGSPHLGGMDLDGRVVELCGLRFAGLEGSLRYRDSIVGYSEQDMRLRALRLEMRAWASGGIDVLVTHAPVRGYGDLGDLPHRGFVAFDGLISRQQPRLMLHGHVHLDYGLISREHVHASGTRIVNCFGWQEIEL